MSDAIDFTAARNARRDQGGRSSEAHIPAWRFVVRPARTVIPFPRLPAALTVERGMSA